MPTQYAKPEAVRRLARRFRSHFELQPVLGPALAAALMSRTPVRTVGRLARIANRDPSTLNKQFAGTSIACRGLTLRLLVDSFLLTRVAGMTINRRTRLAVAAELGVGEATLRRACRFWLGKTMKAGELRLEGLLAAIEARVGFM